jgi:hypothetical protein
LNSGLCICKVNNILLKYHPIQDWGQSWLHSKTLSPKTMIKHKTKTSFFPWKKSYFSGNLIQESEKEQGQSTINQMFSETFFQYLILRYILKWLKCKIDYPERQVDLGKLPNYKETFIAMKSDFFFSFSHVVSISHPKKITCLGVSP